MRRQATTDYIIYLLVSDALLTVLALHTAYMARLHLPLGITLAPRHVHLPPSLYVVAVALWLSLFLLLSVYDPRATLRVHREIQRVLLASGIAAASFAGLLYLTVRDLPRLLYVYFVILLPLYLVIHRLTLRWAFRYAGPRVRDTERVLLVGAGPLGREVARRLRGLSWYGLDLVGFVDDDVSLQGKTVEGVPVLGRQQDMIQVIRNYHVDEVIFALPRRAQARMADVIRSLYATPLSIRVVPDVLDLSMSGASVETFEGIPLIGLRNSPITGFNRVMKRGLDLILAALALLMVWPLMLLIAVAIKVTSPSGPVLFKQDRIGENGRVFKMYKFRTMIPEAEKHFEKVIRRLPDGTVMHKSKDDPRILPIGRILRRFSLDELPQLFNVLKGDMSLVGPRPEIPQMIQYYQPWQWERFSVPPGITGWWQISGRADKPMHLHTEYDLYYIQNYSPLLDLRILWRTIGAVLRGKGAY